MILSNLDMHREQASERASYFDPKGPEQLANILENYVAPNRLQEPALQAFAARRRMAFVTAFEDAVLQTIKQRRSIAEAKSCDKASYVRQQQLPVVLNDLSQRVPFTHYTSPTLSQPLCLPQPFRCGNLKY